MKNKPPKNQTQVRMAWSRKASTIRESLELAKASDANLCSHLDDLIICIADGVIWTCPDDLLEGLADLLVERNRSWRNLRENIAEAEKGIRLLAGREVKR